MVSRPTSRPPTFASRWVAPSRNSRTCRARVSSGADGWGGAQMGGLKAVVDLDLGARGDGVEVADRGDPDGDAVTAAHRAGRLAGVHGVAPEAELRHRPACRRHGTRPTRQVALVLPAVVDIARQAELVEFGPQSNGDRCGEGRACACRVGEARAGPGGSDPAGRDDVQLHHSRGRSRSGRGSRRGRRLTPDRTQVQPVGPRRTPASVRCGFESGSLPGVGRRAVA